MNSSGFTESLTIGITLTLVFGAVCFYLYSRLVQNEKRVSLIESILLDVKMSMEMVGQGRGDHSHDDRDEMAVEQVEAVSAPEPLNQMDVDSSEEELYKDVLQQAERQPEMKAFEVTDSKVTPKADPVQVTKVSPTYESMSVKELKDLAKKRNLKVPSGAGRKELTEALRKAEAPAPLAAVPEGAPPAVEGALLEEDAELTS
jgi:hypothetical protein